MSIETGNHQRLEAALSGEIKGNVSFDPQILGIYATDASIYQIEPVGLVCPLDEADVIAAVRIAAEHDVSILPRGGGTSLAGQAVGQSLVLDFSRHMNRILELNTAERWVRVQPGVVCDELNAALAEHGLQFAPDPATASRANIGGMVGNNTSGTKSILYGKTVDHVVGLKVLLADGSMLDLAALSPADYEAKTLGDSREAGIYRDFRSLIDAHRDEIRERFPKVMRRVGGYCLDEFTETDTWNLAKIFVGSEGTLGVTLEATLNLEPLPKASALCVAHFDDVIDAIRAVVPIVEHGPSAVEILDRTVMNMGRKNRETAPLCEFIEGDPAAILINEFYGDTQDEATGKAQRLADILRSDGRGYAWPVMSEAKDKTPVWEIRKKGLGLMLGMKGDRKPLAFIEDASIPLDVLPEYIDRVLKIVTDAGRDVAMYAHASVGVIHVRPILDLRKQEDIELLKSISEETFKLVVQYGGSWSGEHGDGLVRSPYNERFFGSKLYGAFKSLKSLMDPDGLMNPGKIVDAPPMDQNLRYGTVYKSQPMKTAFKYREDGSFAAAVEMCTGVGDCRKTMSGTMCPSYMATRDERHSTRGRANALRMAMTGQLGPEGMTSETLHETLALCLSCKGCKRECPSNVDMAKLKSEFLQQYYDKHGTTMRDKAIAGAPEMARRFSGFMAPLINGIQRTRVFRGLLERAAGFTARRTLPEYSRQSLSSWFTSRVNGNGHQLTRPKVALFADTYINYYEPNVGRAAVELLESCGYEVVLADVGCCQRTRISHGFLREAQRDGRETMKKLDQLIQRGLPVVVCEPSCASALVDDLPDLMDDDTLAARVSDNVHMIDAFLLHEIEEGRLNCEFEMQSPSVLIHGHCHQKALFGTDAMKNIFGSIADSDVTEVDSGCCGMAGSFGYESEHYDISETIGEQRLFPAVRSAPEDSQIIACGFSCRHQIEHFTGRRPVHWVESVRGMAAEKKE